MGDKKKRKGLDTLRGDIQELTEVVADLRDKLAARQAFSSADHGAGRNHVSPTLSETTRKLEAHARAAHQNGSISAFGFFESAADNHASHVYRWSMEDLSVEEVLGGPINQYAHTLAAIGHPQRLNILLMLLVEPATANDVVTQLELGTTGAAYHHLNVLQAAGFVEQQHRGVFTIVLQRIPALLTILASLSDVMAVEILDQPLDEGEGGEMSSLPEPMATENDESAISGPAA